MKTNTTQTPPPTGNGLAAQPSATGPNPRLHFTATAPNRLFVADFTYVRSWAGFVYVAFVVDAFSQAIVGWHAMGRKHTDLVLTCLRMATWRRAHDGHPVTDGLVLTPMPGRPVHVAALHRALGPAGHRPVDRIGR